MTGKVPKSSLYPSVTVKINNKRKNNAMNMIKVKVRENCLLSCGSP